MANDMNEPELDQHLSRISTMWTALFDAHGSSSFRGSVAREKLLRRYSGAVYRYLYSVLRDTNAADELAQEFALNFLRGGFRGATPEKGRFRDYIKASLFNLIRSWHKQRQRQPWLDVGQVDPADAATHPGDDQAFLRGWRDELLARTWEALLQFENETGRLYHTLLRYKASNPSTPSAAMAETFSKELGKPLTAVNVRQTIHRAREKFGDLLIEEVARSLETTRPEEIEEELINLELHSYCGEAFQRWAADRPN